MGELNRTTEVIRVSKKAATKLRELKSREYVTIASVVEHLLERACMDYQPEENYQKKYRDRLIHRH